MVPPRGSVGLTELTPASRRYVEGLWRAAGRPVPERVSTTELLQTRRQIPDAYDSAASAELTTVYRELRLQLSQEVPSSVLPPSVQELRAALEHLAIEGPPILAQGASRLLAQDRRGAIRWAPEGTSLWAAEERPPVELRRELLARAPFSLGIAREEAIAEGLRGDPEAQQIAREQIVHLVREAPHLPLQARSEMFSAPRMKLAALVLAHTDDPAARLDLLAFAHLAIERRDDFIFHYAITPELLKAVIDAPGGWKLVMDALECDEPLRLYAIDALTGEERGRTALMRIVHEEVFRRNSPKGSGTGLGFPSQSVTAAVRALAQDGHVVPELKRTLLTADRVFCSAITENPVTFAEETIAVPLSAALIEGLSQAPATAGFAWSLVNEPRLGQDARAAALEELVAAMTAQR